MQEIGDKVAIRPELKIQCIRVWFRIEMLVNGVLGGGGK